MIKLAVFLCWSFHSGAVISVCELTSRRKRSCRSRTDVVVAWARSVQSTQCKPLQAPWCHRTTHSQSSHTYPYANIHTHTQRSQVGAITLKGVCFQTGIWYPWLGTRQAPTSYVRRSFEIFGGCHLFSARALLRWIQQHLQEPPKSTARKPVMFVASQYSCRFYRSWSFYRRWAPVVQAPSSLQARKFGGLCCVSFRAVMGDGHMWMCGL